MRFAGQKPDLLRAIKYILGSETIPMSEARRGLVIPRQSWVLDPLEEARRTGDPRYVAAVESALSDAANRESRPVDRGSLEIDRLMRSLGIDTNLSGVGNPPAEMYPITPGVTYKREYYAPRRAGVADRTRPGQMVEFVKFKDTPMMDWDIPSDYHRDANVTVRHLGDVEELARQYVRENPQAMLQLYQTPGGYRAWELGRRMSADSFQPSFESLKVDDAYAAISRIAHSGEVAGIPVGETGFSSRISHKPGRVDWVAQPIMTLSGSEARPDPVSLQRVERYHDAPIRRAYLENGVSPDAVEALSRQLPSASAALQKELSRRFGL